MRLAWMYGAVLATAITAPSSAQVSVYIGVPPPAIRYEEPPPVPGPGFIWVEGYWRPFGHHYRWMKGHWDRPPYEGAYWSHPHYDHYREGWEMHEGHWDHEDHDNGYRRHHGRSRDHHDNGHREHGDHERKDN